MEGNNFGRGGMGNGGTPSTPTVPSTHENREPFESDSPRTPLPLFPNYYHYFDDESTLQSTIPGAPFSMQKYLHRLFLNDHYPDEATGLALNSFARGAAGMSTLFLGPALLTLAKAAAKTDACGDIDDDGTCDEEGKVYGMKPTSLLTNIGMFSGLLSVIFLPLFGAIVDHTSHRKTVGQCSAMLLSIVKGVEIFISQSTWFYVSILQVVNYVLHNAHLCAVYAYTAELSTIPNEQTKYNSKFQTVNYLSMLIFLIVVMIASELIGTGNVGTARISQTTAFIVCTSIFGISWHYFFQKRPALSEVPSNSNLFKAGFLKLASTFSQIWTNWYAIRYFLLSVMLSESATSALSTISTTYMTHVLGMDASQIGKAFIFVFVAGIPGSKVGGFVGTVLNPLRSAQLCLVVFIGNTTLAACLLQGPESLNLMYIFAAIWGICLGWLHPTHAALYCTLIPKGQESELMGVYIFSGALLSWLPPCLFTILNESGTDMSIGLASLNVFFAGGLIFLLLIGDYTDAMDCALVPWHDSGDTPDDNIEEEPTTMVTTQSIPELL